jgi:acetyl-CoA acetyltransferase
VPEAVTVATARSPIGRAVAVLSGRDHLPGVTVNRYSSSSLQWHDEQLVVESMCVGGGMGLAMVLERLS